MTYITYRTPAERKRKKKRKQCPSTIQQRKALVDGRTTMSNESVCQVARSWVDVSSFHMRLFGVVYVTCGNFHDGSEKGTASVHQILCQSWEKYYGVETLTMIQQAFGDQSLSRAQVFQWHAWSKTSCTSVDDDEHAGRSTSCTTPETVARIQELVSQDRCQTIHNIAEEVGIGYGT
jgi:hypothetical protein